MKREKKDVFRRLEELSHLVKDLRDFDGIANEILKTACEVTSSLEGTIFIEDKSQKMLIFKYVRGKAEKVLKNTAMPINKGVVGWSFTNVKPIIINEPEKSEFFYNGVDKKIQHKTKNILANPIVIDGESKGVLELINTINKEGYTELDIDNTSLLMLFLSVSLQNRELYLSNERRIKYMDDLVKIGNELNSTHDLKKLIIKANAELTSLLNAEASTIFLISEDGKSLDVYAVEGGESEALKKIKTPIKGSIAGYVATTGETMKIDDVKNEKRHYKKADEKTKFVTHSMIAVPLKVKGVLSGALEVLNKKSPTGGYAFDDEDVEAAKAFANQFATAIENVKLLERLKNLFNSTIRAISTALDKRDPYTKMHSGNVARYAKMIAKEIGLTEEKREGVYIAGLLHDVGKIGIMDSVLLKKGKLNPEEYELIKSHSVKGYEIMKDVKELRKSILNGIKYHHEKWNGKGYPEGLSGKNIPLFARIIGVADVFDALTTDRPYRKALSYEKAKDMIEEDSGKAFDPDVVEAFIRVYKKTLER